MLGHSTLSVFKLDFYVSAMHSGGDVWVEKEQTEVHSRKLTRANLYYSSRHKRDNYWCGSQDREKERAIAEEKAEGVR